MSPSFHPPIVNARPAVTALAVLLLGLVWTLLAPQIAGAEETTYSSTRAIAVPPSSSFKTSEAGGDGWAVAFSESAVYNVYHHSGALTVACHLQASGARCFAPETITDGEGHGFGTPGHPEMYFDQKTGKLYVYATRSSDSTAGVVCIDTTLATEEPDPFCGFTALSGVGEAPFETGHSGLGTPTLVGSRWYAFNTVANVNVVGSENELLCFDVSTDAACSGQPFNVGFGEGNLSESYSGPASAAIGGRLLIPLEVGGSRRMACFQAVTQSGCPGTWPLTIPSAGYGTAFPLLSKGGAVSGFCLPTGADPCYTLEGASTETPAGMPAVIEGNDEWNGPALTLGSRVYVANGLPQEGVGNVQCFDYATGAGCAHFPKTFSGLEYLYTVNRDPQRPSCIWVNSDDGEEQIQDFDAYTGEPCGAGPTRALAAQFVASAPKCTPTSFVSLKVVNPARSAYTSGTVSFADGDGNPITALGERAIDASGAAGLAGLEPVTEAGLPQFLFAFSGLGGELTGLDVQLTWRGISSPECEVDGITAQKSSPAAKVAPAPPPSPAPTPTVAPAVLACTRESLALVNVAPHAGRVLIQGVARQALEGRTVGIELVGTGRTVAHAVVAADGRFTATAPLPASGIRTGNRARYRAVLGSLTSLPLKLYRRMYVTRASATGAWLHLAGMVTGRYRRGAEVAVFRRQSCGGEREVGRARLGRGGRFSLVVANAQAPAGQVAVYRARTTVLKGAKAFLTYTLPTEPTA